MDATPAISWVAAIAAHDKGEEVGTTPYTVITIHTSPAVYMGSGPGSKQHRNRSVNKRTGEIFLVPLRTIATLPPNAAQVAELVVAATPGSVSSIVV